MRRGRGRIKNKNGKTKQFTLIGANMAAIKQKIESLKNVAEEFDAGCLIIQETLLKNKGQIKIDDHQIFELVRKSSNGGGLMIAAKEELFPVLIMEGDDETELSVIELNLNNLQVRICNGYGPQENDTLDKRVLFMTELENQIEKAADNDKGLIVELHINAKLGKEILGTKDPNPISDNGKMLLEIIERQNLFIVNTFDICKGAITRRRD